jgi:hypothetical protein
MMQNIERKASQGYPSHFLRILFSKSFACLLADQVLPPIANGLYFNTSPLFAAPKSRPAGRRRVAAIHFGRLRSATVGYGRLRKTPGGVGGISMSTKPSSITNYRPCYSPPHACAPGGEGRGLSRRSAAKADEGELNLRGPKSALTFILTPDFRLLNSCNTNLCKPRQGYATLCNPPGGTLFRACQRALEIL